MHAMRVIVASSAVLRAEISEMSARSALLFARIVISATARLTVAVRVNDVWIMVDDHREEPESTDHRGRANLFSLPGTSPGSMTVQGGDFADSGAAHCLEILPCSPLAAQPTWANLPVMLPLEDAPKGRSRRSRSVPRRSAGYKIALRRSETSFRIHPFTGGLLLGALRTPRSGHP